jgi:hypothetical protein
MVEKQENIFFTFGVCVKQILGIMKSHIEIKKVFSLAQILISPRKCLLQKNLNNLIFIKKNWHNDFRI